MSALSRRLFIASGAAAIAAPTGAFARAPEIFMDDGGVFGKAWTHALGGYDTVAYHSLAPDAEPVPGDESYQAMYKGVSWIFSSQDNLDAFQSDPDRYRPQYGGYCAWAMARNKLAKGDPAVWLVRDGKLYLNVSARIKRQWLKNIERDIARADANWPGILDRN